MIDTNQMAPDFTLPISATANVALSDLRGSPVVLFFYPRDNTPGCTIESIAFSHLLPEFAALGAKVFGVSKDDLASHDKFTTKQNLTVPLLSDENGTVCEDYGVWAEKNMYGKKFMGIVRGTVLIDSAGQVVRTWPNVKVQGHAEEVLEAVKAL